MNKSVICISNEKCTGCGACLNICPSNAITMDYDSEGFLFPFVDGSKCINCGLCVKICPTVNKTNKNESFEPECYGVKNDYEIMKNSTTAGIFWSLANQILSNDGYVCGAIFNDEFEVTHILSNEEEEVSQMRKSKYVQSYSGHLFSKIKQLLDIGTPILFTGTPCQINGLRNFLNKEYENLYLVDLVCFGVPSPMMWKKYLNENFNINKLKGVDFRFKGDFEFRKNRIAYEMKDGTIVIKEKNKDFYYIHFSNRIGFRKSCYTCSFADFPRVSDITIGDWWGSQKVDPDVIDRDRGIGVVIINSSKGKKIYEKIQKSFSYERKITLEEALKDNCSHNRESAKIKPERALFYKYTNQLLFEEAVKKALYPQYDALIFGVTLNNNYGAAMTYYALYEILNDLGYNVALTSFRDYRIRTDHAAQFFKKYTKIAPVINKENINQYSMMTSTFLLGSDQVWNYKIFKQKDDKCFYFDKVGDDVKKISFAASFGFNYSLVYEYEPQAYYLLKRMIRKFDNISVREASGVDICRKDFDVEATLVLDPVFCIDKNHYEKLADQAKEKVDEKYLASYEVSHSDEFNKLLLYISEKKGLSIVNMITGHPERFEKQKELSVGKVCEDLTEEEWLNNIRNCEYLVTTSFHGMCFALIFEKPFVIFKNGPLERIESLLNILGLSDRLIYSWEEIKEKTYLLSDSIDYPRVREKITKLSADSVNWLKNALKNDKKNLIHELKTLHKEPAHLISTTHNIWDYLRLVQEEDYILVSCINGNVKENYPIKLLLEYCKSQSEVSIENNDIMESHEKNIILKEHEILLNYNGKTNCRTQGIKFRDNGRLLKNSAHNPFRISFDWETDAKCGSFYIQLNGAPWKALTSVIEISPNNQKGHYEGIFALNENIKLFSGEDVQIRTDYVSARTIIRDLEIVKGNEAKKPLDYVSAVSIEEFNGFAMIFDNSARYFDYSKNAAGTMVYKTNSEKIIVDYQNNSFMNSSDFADIIIEQNGKRHFYPCKERGFYCFLYSKKLLNIIDVLYIGDQVGKTELFHMC